MTSCPDLYQEGSYMKISKQYFNYFIRMRSTFFSMFIFRTFCTLPFLERHDINEFGRQFVAPQWPESDLSLISYHRVTWYNTDIDRSIQCFIPLANKQLILQK